MLSGETDLLRLLKMAALLVHLPFKFSGEADPLLAEEISRDFFLQTQQSGVARRGVAWPTSGARDSPRVCQLPIRLRMIQLTSSGSLGGGNCWYLWPYFKLMLNGFRN